MYEVKAIVRRERLHDVIGALHEMADVPGITVSVVTGIGRRTGAGPSETVEYGETDMAKLELVVPEALRDRVVQAVQQAGSTGHAGDGKVFITRVEDAVTIRSGAHGLEAL